jgi:hypothetical protein
LNGQGETAEQYVAMLRLGDLVELLIAAGFKGRKDLYSDIDISKCKGCGAYVLSRSKCLMCEDEDAG